jgi:flavodoxin
MDKKAVIIYWSRSGNTRKVAYSINKGLEESGVRVSLFKVEDAEEIDYFDYDLVCIGFPSYQWHPPPPIVELLKKNHNKYLRESKVKPGAPKIPGKCTLIFCTYSGPHTGICEATPAGDYAGQFFEHIGFTVIDKWYILSEFHGSLKASTEGKLGDIKGKPTEEDLKRIRTEAKRLAGKLD